MAGANTPVIARYARRWSARATIASLLVAMLTGLVTAAVDRRIDIGAFSDMRPGPTFGPDWQVTELASINPARFGVERIDSVSVVRVDAQGAAASLTRAVDWDVAAAPSLHWRWRIDRVVERGDLSTKATDDFAARLYVLFNFPLDELPLLARTKLRIARWIYGDQVPAAALCYVWANAEARGTRAWSAYTDRVRVIVLRNRDDAVGEWVGEARNVLDDYREAFGSELAPVSGVAIAADTDQTGESVTAWFGDISASAASLQTDRGSRSAQ